MRQVFNPYKLQPGGKKCPRKFLVPFELLVEDGGFGVCE
jgi:hypothetical protein